MPVMLVTRQPRGRTSSCGNSVINSYVLAHSCSSPPPSPCAERRARRYARQRRPSGFSELPSYLSPISPRAPPVPRARQRRDFYHQLEGIRSAAAAFGRPIWRKRRHTTACGRAPRQGEEAVFFTAPITLPAGTRHGQRSPPDGRKQTRCRGGGQAFQCERRWKPFEGPEWRAQGRNGQQLKRSSFHRVNDAQREMAHST